MNIYEEKVEELKKYKREVVFLNVLNLFPQTDDNKQCLACIMNLYDQIKDELISYQHLQDPKLLNHIQNDLTTLHDLVEEYHKYGYLDFDIKALMLLSMLSFNDLVVVSGQIRDNYLCIDYYTKLKDTLKETFKMNDLSAKYNIMITSIDTAIENDLERYITIIKHEQKLDEQYKQNYLKIIGLYFIYMCRKDKKYV